MVSTKCMMHDFEVVANDVLLWSEERYLRLITSSYCGPQTRLHESLSTT